MRDSSPAALRERVDRLTWVHSIDLGQGVTTHGRFGPPARIIREAFDTLDFRDKKVLDIGCWDGLWSFEAERRGAREVHATDYVSQRWGRGSPTLLTAREILGSSVHYHPDLSVYDAPARFPERDFDIVIFAGVYYHLKHPLLALARLRQVLKTGGMIIVEGEAINDRRRSRARFWYADYFARDRSNWWIPTIRCLREWMDCSCFSMRSEHLNLGDWFFRGGCRRMALTAEAVARSEPHDRDRDEDLRAFDEKVYQ